MNRKIDVLVVDDSAVVRRTLSDILASDPGIEVMAAVADPYAAVERIKQRRPDVILLDVEMPRMDGLTFLRKIMSQHPIPVIICSALAEQNCATTLKALDYGAVEIVQKPRTDTKEFLETSAIRIRDAVRAAASARLDRLPVPLVVTPKLSADVIIRPPASMSMVRTTERVVVVGASTGGTEALRVFLEELPPDAPGVVVVQHMPKYFTKAFAKRLDDLCAITVQEAAGGDSVIRGRALIAPGDKHLLLKRSGARYYVEIKDGPLVCRHRPSVDVLFRSASRYAGRNAVGIIMTGMGDDGAKGISEMKEAGATTIAQDEASCVVYGMPREAVARGVIDRILPLEQIAREVIDICG